MQFDLSTKVSFGYGKIDQLQPLLDRNTFLVISRSAEKNLADLLKQVGVSQRYQVVREPSIEDVNLAIQAAQSAKRIVGIGGGSAMDVAKAVAISLENGLQQCDALFGTVVSEPRKRIELILCPTTSGTGSELSYGSIIYNRFTKIKGGIRGVGVRADSVIVDPQLTLSCPEVVTMETGFDCFAHAVETYISNKSSELIRSLSLTIIRHVLQYLPALKIDLTNREAREKMAFSSMLAGFNLSHSGTCLPHRIQYAFKQEWGYSHALGLAAIYPHWIAVTSCNHDGFKRLERALGLPFTDTVDRLLASTGLRDQIEIKKQQYRLTLDSTSVQGNLADDPGYHDQNLREILKSLAQS